MSSLQTAFRTLLFSSGVFLACALAVVAALPPGKSHSPASSPIATVESADPAGAGAAPADVSSTPSTVDVPQSHRSTGRISRHEPPGGRLSQRTPAEDVGTSSRTAPSPEPVELIGIDGETDDGRAVPKDGEAPERKPSDAADALRDVKLRHETRRVRTERDHAGVDDSGRDEATLENDATDSGSRPRVELVPPLVIPSTRPRMRPQSDRTTHSTQRPQRRVFFEAAPTTPEERPDARLEARLVSMEKRLTQLVKAQSEQRSSDWQQATQLVQQLQQSNQLQSLERQLRELQRRVEEPPPAATSPTTTPPVQPAEPSEPESAASPPGPKRPVLKAQSDDAHPERFSMQFQDAEIAEVLAMLGELAGINILVGQDVTGKVPAANLQDVTIDQALNAILRSLGYVFEREDEFVFVMTAQEAQARKNLERKLITKVYRPHYISVTDLEALIIPLQTPEVGKVAKTSPSEVGIAPSAESAGGNQLSQSDAIVVVDYPEVIAEIDQVVAEMDVPPQQVVIEAMILSVSLTDELEFGVNFALLNGKNDNLWVFGNGQTLGGSSGFPGTGESIVPPMGEFVADAAGLKYGFLRGDVSGFIEALETISDTNLIASPQIRVLNKQKAELIIGEQLAYTTTTQNGTSSVENVNFLDVGTKLILRPFISSDGLVRMEIHPEQSAGVIDNRGLPNKTTTEVTTNVMVRDGTTVVIGGLIEEQVTESVDRVPLLGAIPLVGAAFRNKTERIERTELIVLITPRVVREPEAEIEGDVIRYENERRHEHFRNELSPINRRNLARAKRERAEYYFERGDYKKALHHVEAALEYNKNDLQALRLRDLIQEAHHAEKRHWFHLPGRGKN